MIKCDGSFIYIETKSTLLLLEIEPYFFEDEVDFHNLFITQRYYGLKTKKKFNPSEPLIRFSGSSKDYNQDYLISSSFGDGGNYEVSSLIFNSDNTFVNRFFFKEAIVFEGGKEFEGPHARNVLQTLEITEEDKTSNLKLKTYYSIFADTDVIVVKKELINCGKECSIRRLFSLECPIPSRDISINTYDGQWLNERNRHTTRLTSGVFTNQSLVGSSSHRHNPFIEINDHENQMFYAFNLIYSGNHKEMVEVKDVTHTSIFIGINDFAFDYLLKSNSSFVTPEAVMIVSNNKDKITYEMHNFVNNHVINPDFKSPRPILYSSWEGMGFAINEKALLDTATIAKKVGIELFVIDDGWFKGRNNDSSSLGDWVVDTNKFPSGLKEISQKIKGLGLQFGIWVEPEMISKISDIYRINPEFAQEIPNRKALERRHQLMIDMANPKVVDYLYNSLSKVFEEAEVDYVKWDYNRLIIDAYSSIGVRCGEFMHRFIMGTYNLIERLTNRFPHILFESCASGGGRYDLGMIYYMPQTWGSDNSNAYWRAFIACGTFAGYPQSTFGTHISIDGGKEKKISSLEDRFNINSIGGFGYEFDLRKRSEKELSIIKKQITYFKKHRKLIQFGHYYVVDDCFDDCNYYSFCIVSDNKNEAILSMIELTANCNGRNWKFKGLKESAIYKIEMREQDNASKMTFDDMSGKELMEKGIAIPSLFKSNNDHRKYPNGIFSRMIYIKKK